MLPSASPLHLPLSPAVPLENLNRALRLHAAVKRETELKIHTWYRRNRNYDAAVLETRFLCGISEKYFLRRMDTDFVQTIPSAR